MAERRGNGLQSRVHGFESRLHLARLAQRESASLTRKRSLVQSQYRAPPETAGQKPCPSPEGRGFSRQAAMIRRRHPAPGRPGGTAGAGTRTPVSRAPPGTATPATAANGPPRLPGSGSPSRASRGRRPGRCPSSPAPAAPAERPPGSHPPSATCRPSSKVNVGRVGGRRSPAPASSSSTPSYAGRQNRIRKFDRRGCPSGVQRHKLLPMSLHQLLIGHRDPRWQCHESSTGRGFRPALLRPGVSPSRRRALATICVMIITFTASFVDLPANLLQRRPNLDPALLGVVLMPLVPDQFTPSGAGVEVHQAQHEPGPP